MTKGPSKDSAAPRDQSLPRAKILRGRKNFKRLFEHDAHSCRGNYADLRYKIVDETSFGCQMGFIVKKGLGKANKRNKMKRLLREAYRRHQHILSDFLLNANVTFHGALMANVVDANYRDVEQNVIALLQEVQEQLSTISPGNS